MRRFPLYLYRPGYELTTRATNSYRSVRFFAIIFGFEISGRTGSHVRLSKLTSEGKVGTVVPMHKEIKIGTLKSVLRLAKISEEEFAKYL